MKVFHTIIFTLILVMLSQSNAQVNYDNGRIMINGIQLLQDSNDPSSYYYLPDYPRLAHRDDGDMEVMCIKYIGQGGNASGGLFHALIQFDLPEEVIAELTKELKKKDSSAKIAGVIPMKQAISDGEDGIASFKIVSSILSNTDGKNAFTQNVITSGHAPLYKDSKAAIAAKLNQEGATLLWESLQGKTSDVSVVVSGFYEAKVKGYNATVQADMSNVYEHYSKIYNSQQEYTKRQVRKATDEMIQEQVLNIDVFDRSSGLGIDSGDMEGILSIVTDKLIELMFDAEVGWAKQPDKETVVDKGQLKGRRERGFFSKLFGGAPDEKYFTDNQFVLKNREDIKTNKFYLNLSRATTIKVPVFSSGNIGGLYETIQENPETVEKYFRVVDMEDPDFLKREIIFQLDGLYVESFKDILNSVSVNFRKVYSEADNKITRDVLITAKDLVEGTDYKKIYYPRMGDSSTDWLDYQYKISWNLKGDDKALHVPPNKNTWETSNDASLVLTPPFIKRSIQLDIDPSSFEDAGFQTCSIRFFTILNGRPNPQKSVIIRKGDAENSIKVNLYHDREEPVVYQISWYGSNEIREMDPVPLEGNYLYLIANQETSNSVSHE